MAIEIGGQSDHVMQSTSAAAAWWFNALQLS